MIENTPGDQEELARQMADIREGWSSATLPSAEELQRVEDEFTSHMVFIEALDPDAVADLTRKADEIIHWSDSLFDA